MKMSRRKFAECTAIAAGGVCLLGPTGWNSVDQQARNACVILDLGPNCVLRESLRGYQAALREATVRTACEHRGWRRSSGLVIAPGAGVLDARVAALLTELLDAGKSVLLESGAGFLNMEGFARQRDMLSESLGVTVREPVELWTQNWTTLYVHFEWPRELLVRDFSRAVPVAAEGAEIIGRVSALPVVVKKQVGNGTLIFLGSPLGPALRAGDREAHAWLQTLALTI